MNLSVKKSILAVLLVAGPGLAENWPQWRGPHLNGTSTETNLPTTWSKTEMKEKKCLSTISVSGGKLFLRTPGFLYCIALAEK